MSNDAEIDRRLTEIRDDVRSLRTLLIGSADGTDGVLNRITRVEQRQSLWWTCYLYLVFGFFSLTYMVVPAYFRQKWGN